MKNLVTLSLILLGLFTHAQSDNYLLKSVYIIDEYDKNIGDTTDMYEYIYNDDWTLNQLIWHKYNDTIYERFEYNNDRLIYSEKAISYRLYHYYNDSVIIDVNYNNGSQKTEKCFFDDDGRVVEYQRVYPNEEIVFYEWEGENVYHQYSQQVSFLNSYYYEYSNPYFNQNKNLRIGTGGSDKYIYEMDDLKFGPDHLYNVIESIENYPSLVHFYLGILHDRTYVFNYHIVTDIDEIPPEHERVLSIYYYNLSGQKIEKPERGFYIERKQTRKGIVATKHFIP